MMDLSPDKLAAASLNQQLVTAAVLRAVASAPKPLTEEADLRLAIGSTLDGVLAALAYLAEATELYPQPSDRRRFAGQCRQGLIKFMKAARTDLDAGVDWEVGPEGKPN